MVDTDHFSTRLRRSGISRAQIRHTARAQPVITASAGSQKIFRHDRHEAKTVDAAKARAQNRAPYIKTEHHFVR
jgi:hypothetical protein